MTHLPETMAEVTASWLQQAVADHPAFHGRRIFAAHGKGLGQMSALARFELGYAGEAGPASIVVKLHAPFRAMRDIGIRYEISRARQRSSRRWAVRSQCRSQRVTSIASPPAAYATTARIGSLLTSGLPRWRSTTAASSCSAPS